MRWSTFEGPSSSSKVSTWGEFHRKVKVLTDADIVTFFLSWTLPHDPKEAERLLLRIKQIADTALLEVWNGA